MRQGSRRSASGVKEKRAGGQGKVRQGSRRSASAEYHTFIGSTSPWPPMHFSLTPDALLLDPRGTYPRPLTHFSLTPDTLFLDLEGLFFRAEKSKTMVNKKSKIILENDICIKIFIRFSGQKLFLNLGIPLSQYWIVCDSWPVTTKWRLLSLATQFDNGPVVSCLWPLIWHKEEPQWPNNLFMNSPAGYRLHLESWSSTLCRFIKTATKYA